MMSLRFTKFTASLDLFSSLLPFMDRNQSPKAWLDVVRQIDCLEVSSKNNKKGIPHDEVLGRSSQFPTEGYGYH